jgi:hypothetical protein
MDLQALAASPASLLSDDVEGKEPFEVVAMGVYPFWNRCGSRPEDVLTLYNEPRWRQLLSHS